MGNIRRVLWKAEITRFSYVIKILRQQKLIYERYRRRNVIGHYSIKYLDTGYVRWPILSNVPEKTRERITLPLNVLLALPMFLRLYIFGRYVVLHSSHYQVFFPTPLQIWNFRTGLCNKNDRVVKPCIGRFSVCRPKSALWKTSANFVNCIRNILDNYLLDAYAMWTVGSIVRYFWNSCSILAMPFQVYQDISISSIICGSRLLWVEKCLNIWSLFFGFRRSSA